MKTKESQGFFCVIYFIDTQKTAYFHKVWNPSKLAAYYENRWKWIKIFKDKQDYYSNTKTTSYHAIFDENNPVSNFTFYPYTKAQK